MQPICTRRISLQSSKPSHAYPIIRLPRAFRRLAGAAATIYETTHNGPLAFLVVPRYRGTGLTSYDVEKRSLDIAEVAGPNPAEPIVPCNPFDKTKQQPSSAKRAGMTKNETGRPTTLLKYPELRFDTARKYLKIISEPISEVLTAPDATTVEHSRAIGYLVGVGLKALEIGSLEDRLSQMETALETERVSTYAR